jgi:hypothetical protein
MYLKLYSFKRVVWSVIITIGLLPSASVFAQSGSRAISTPQTGNTTRCDASLELLDKLCDGADICFSAKSTGSLGTKRLRHKGVLRVVDLNPVRYEYSISRDVQKIDEPVDFLKLGILPPLPSAGAQPAAAAAPTTNQAQSGGARTLAQIQQDIAITTQALDQKRIDLNFTEQRILATAGSGTARALEKLTDERDQIRFEIASLEKRLQRLQEELAALRVSEVDDTFKRLVGNWNTQEGEIIKLQARARDVRDRVNEVSQETQSFIDTSDGYSPRSMLIRIGELLTRIEANTSPQLAWPDSMADTIKTELQRIAIGLSSMKGLPGFADWAKQGQNQAVYDSVVSRIQALIKYIDDDFAKAKVEWNKVVAKLKDIQARFYNICKVGARAFIYEETIGCDDSPPEKVTYSLGRKDLAGSKELPSIPMVTVECSHPISLSTGIAFSSLNEDEFSFENRVNIVDGKPVLDPSKVIASKKLSKFRPVPLLLINTHLAYLGPNLSLHFSFGAGVDIKTGKPGSDLEFLTGPSLMIRERFLVTGGAHIGRVVKLIDGFKVGDLVPGELTEVPTRKEYKVGFGIAFTYRIK